MGLKEAGAGLLSAFCLTFLIMSAYGFFTIEGFKSKKATDYTPAEWVLAVIAIVMLGSSACFFARLLYITYPALF